MQTISLPSPTELWRARPDKNDINTIVIHGMYHPEHPQPFSLLACKQRLDDFEVSCHYLIDGDGIIAKSVPEEARARHAGVSKMPFPDYGREGVNDFSIGIELIHSEKTLVTSSQYRALRELICDIQKRHKIAFLVGHEDISPGRKEDPYNFDWKAFEAELCADPRLRFRPRFVPR